MFTTKLNLVHFVFSVKKGMDEAKMDKEVRYQEELGEFSLIFMVHASHCVLASAMLVSAIRPCCPRNKSNQGPSFF
jgi:hypothetical protein